MTTPVCIIDANGITAPAFSDVLAYFVNAYRSIYGSDTYLGNDSQDGQWVAMIAAAVNDCNAQAVACYNAFSPTTAQGTGLSRNVKTNGLTRAVPTFSTVDVQVVGVAGTTVTDGAITDANGNRWNLPATVTIPPAGTITVTATAALAGAISAPSNTVTGIATPTRGWQSVTNALASVPGAPVESDAALRRRQAISTALPSRTVLEGTVGAVAALAGVTRYAAYENMSDITDTNGVPSHSIALVVEGGNAAAIAAAIAAKKGPGCGTYGTTSQNVTDAYGITRAIKFYRPTTVPITYAVTVKALQGFTTAIQAQIQQAVSDFTNGLAIGQNLYRTRAHVPANLSLGVGSSTFEVTTLLVARDGGTPGSSDITIAFNEAASCVPASVAITVV